MTSTRDEQFEIFAVQNGTGVAQFSDAMRACEKNPRQHRAGRNESGTAAKNAAPSGK
jgi:hypothetical protein